MSDTMEKSIMMMVCEFIHFIWRTYNESQKFVRQQAGGDEGHPQSNIQLLGQLRLNPHEQTAQTHTHTHTILKRLCGSSFLSDMEQTVKINSLLYFLQDVRHLSKQILWVRNKETNIFTVKYVQMLGSCDVKPQTVGHLSPELSERRPEPAETSLTQSGLL